MLRRGGTSTSIVSGGRRKVHTTFEDGREMVEEFDVVTDELVLRKVRQGKTALGREGSWVYEVGDEPVKAAAFGVDGPMLMESGSNVRIKREKLPIRNHRKRRVPVFAPDIGIATDGNPHFSRVDTRDSFQWRVRNLPYPESTYSVTIDEADNKLVIHTTNKKYYKRFGVPEMDVLKRRLDQDDLSWYHRNNALVISYTKPPDVISAEREDKVTRQTMRSSAQEQDGDIDCKQQ